ncbi:hypothetical protein [Sphingobium chlorophenolicum]|uniref:hypothetical protein n=1 Tax=Sphingobium chlorophenolicum TaxID=46429 RepID=UPI00117C25FD|nr:hypothetical protein [Sphingobium chlorophenolicum]
MAEQERPARHRRHEDSLYTTTLSLNSLGLATGGTVNGGIRKTTAYYRHPFSPLDALTYYCYRLDSNIRGKVSRHHGNSVNGNGRC